MGSKPECILHGWQRPNQNIRVDYDYEYEHEHEHGYGYGYGQGYNHFTRIAVVIATIFPEEPAFRLDCFAAWSIATGWQGPPHQIFQNYRAI